MNGSYKNLLSNLTALLWHTCDWIRSIWFLVWTNRLTRQLLLGGIRKESQCKEWNPSVIIKSKFKSEIIDGIPKRKYEDIPMAKGWPLIGTTLDLIAAGSAPNLHKYIHKRHQQFGHIFRERLGTQEAVFVSSANLMRSVFLYEGKYPTHPLPDSWVLYNKLHNCQRGLFFMDGPEWHTNRKIMNRLLLNGNLDWMNLYTDFCTDKLIAKWKKGAENEEGYFEIIDMEGELYRWAIDVVCTIMFGNKTDSADNKLGRALDEFSKDVHKIFETSAELMNFPPKLARTLHMKIWSQFEKNVTDVLKLGYEIIDIHMQLNLEEWDSYGLFAKMRLAGMSMEVIKRIFVDLIIAAGDTTAFSAQWALYLLSQHPEMQCKIRFEKITSNSESPFVRGFIRETLRLYPVAPFIGRFLATDAIIGDYEIKEKTMVILSLYTSGRDADHFPDPLDVKPERWLRDNDTGNFKNVLQAHGTLPFGVGSRSCIGKKIALYQMHNLVEKIAHCFEIKCFNEKAVDVVLRLVAVPNPSLKLGIKLIENKKNI